MDRSILLVEDNPDDAMLVQRAFRKAGFNTAVRVIEDGDAAVAFLAGEPPYAGRNDPLPSLLVVDLKLPRRSGFEIIEWVRSRPCLRRLPIVVLTSSSESRDIQRAYDAGANSYLVKPVSSEASLAMVHTLCLYWLTLNQIPAVSRS